jgi:hypothetical protein
MEILIFNWNILIFHGDFPLPDSDSQILSFGSVKDQPTVLGQVDNQNKSETKFDILGMFFSVVKPSATSRTRIMLGHRRKT